MAGMNLFYNNLLSNIRFHSKIHCYTFGQLVYDLPNIICCHNILNKLCRDRWFTVPTAIKWSIKTIYLIVLIALIKNYKINNPEVTAFNEEIEDFYMSFDDLLIVYTLQHVIFIILRPIFFIIFMVASVGHNQGQAYDKFDTLDDSIISYNYIKHMSGSVNGFEGRP